MKVNRFKKAFSLLGRFEDGSKQRISNNVILFTPQVCFLDDTTFTVASGGDDGLCKVRCSIFLLVSVMESLTQA